VNKVSGGIRRNAPLIAALCIAGAAALAILLLILRETGGRLIYSLDDAYIHMAVAKHLAEKGVWGVTSFGFSSSSSSLLWPLLLAAMFRVFGVLEIFPFLFVLAAAAMLIMLLYREWSRREDRRSVVFFMLLGAMLLLPLGPVLFNGMETMLQALSVVALSAAAVGYLAAERPRSPLLLCLLAGLASAVRYEGCFVALAVCLLMVLRGRIRAAVAVGFSAAIPVVLYGLVSLSHGWSFLPNSLLIKHSGVDFSDPLALWNMITRPFGPITDIDVLRQPMWQPMAVVLLALIFLRSRSEPGLGFWNARVLPAAIFLLVAVSHSLWITVEGFFRYQAYLNALGIWAIGCAGLPSADWAVFRRNAAAALAALCALLPVAVPLGSFAFRAAWQTPVASQNIWEQQYQMGLFLKEYYPQEAVAANDIGAVSFLADPHLVDLFGLASIPVMQAKLNGEWHTDLAGALERITVSEGARIAVIYDNWFGYVPGVSAAKVPSAWVRVADWTISHNVVCGGPTVTWYALAPEEASALLAALEAFSAKLPHGVAVRYYPIP
jgi:hypothetical protein